MMQRMASAASVTLGAIGSLISIAAAVGAVVFIISANNTVSGIEDRITSPIDRLSEQVNDASETAADAASSEVEARLAGIRDQASAAGDSLDAISEHPLYANLPVDVSELETTLQSITDRADELSEVEPGESLDGSRVGGELEELSETLGTVATPIENVADSLRFWTRISGLVLLALALWSLWGQVSLFRQGRNQRSAGEPTLGRKAEA